jgi:iron complex transport system ATP-binding protein
MEIVTHIKEQYGMTVIMVLHDINHALQYADELAVLTNHQIIAQGAPQDILTVDMLAKVFHVKADIFTNSQGAAVLSPVELVK